MCNKVGLLLMSHGDFAKEIIKSAELIIGKQDNYDSLGVHLDDQIDNLKEEMFKKIDKLDTSKGLVVFTDIVGGSPMNLAGNLLDRDNILVCSGMNLPVLLECLFNRDKSIDDLTSLIRSAYNAGMTMRTSEMFAEEEDENDLLL